MSEQFERWDTNFTGTTEVSECCHLEKHETPPGYSSWKAFKSFAFFHLKHLVYSCSLRVSTITKLWHKITHLRCKQPAVCKRIFFVTLVVTLIQMTNQYNQCFPRSPRYKRILKPTQKAVIKSNHFFCYWLICQIFSRLLILYIKYQKITMWCHWMSCFPKDIQPHIFVV